MLHSNAGERLAERVGLTLFDLIVLVVVALLVTAIGLSAALGISDPVDRVAYLKLDDRGLYELWISTPGDEDSAEQITETQNGVYDYDVSDDGNYIAFTERDFQTGIAEIYLMTLATGQIEQITTCVMQDSDCSAPVFHPEGDFIAYERVSLNNELSPVGIGAPRIWLIDLTTGASPPPTFPLVDDTQVLGRSAVWSANGERIAFYDFATSSIIVYDLTAGDDEAFVLVPTRVGIMGSLSPDGTQLIYPVLNQNRGYLQLADLDSERTQILYEPGQEIDDQQTAWSPDGRYVAIGRRAGQRATQLYALDTRTTTIAPLLTDNRYVHSFFSWNDSGERLVMQRFQQLDELGNFNNDGKLEVWTYELETRQLIKIAEDARSPQWVNR
jgi:Tol biopolymer transport system component